MKFSVIFVDKNKNEIPAGRIGLNAINAARVKLGKDIKVEHISIGHIPTFGLFLTEEEASKVEIYQNVNLTMNQTVNSFSNEKVNAFCESTTLYVEVTDRQIQVLQRELAELTVYDNYVYKMDRVGFVLGYKYSKQKLLGLWEEAGSPVYKWTSKAEIQEEEDRFRRDYEEWVRSVQAIETTAFAKKSCDERHGEED